MRPLKPLVLTPWLLCAFAPSISSAATTMGDYGVSTTGYVSASQLITTNVSLTTGATTWGYISSTGSYLPNFATNRISTTSISVTNLTMTGTPTATTDAANKAYVDAAVVAAAGGTSSVAGTACYTVYSAACASGWQQMPGYTFAGSNGSQVNNCCIFPGAAPSDALPIGYAVKTESDYNGNLGGLNGANATCLTELQTKPWAGKADSQARGMLNSSKVKAYLCDGTTCNNFQPYTRYYSAVAGGLNAGQGYAESSAGESYVLNFVGGGPTYYLVGTQTSGVYWTGRNSGGSSGNYCSGWITSSGGQSGTVGKNSGSSASETYSYTSYTCNSNARLICLVNP